MPPASSLTNLLHSPSASSEASTIHGNGRTLPDISLGSLGSSFRSDDQEEGRKIGRTPVARAPRLPAIISPETSASTDIATPSPHAPATALLSLTPPTAVRRSSSHSALPDTVPGSLAPRRSRILRRDSTSSISSDEADVIKGGYGDHTETDAVLSTLSINVSPKLPISNGLGKSYGAPSRRGGRHSVAAADMSSGPLTLRDQEQQLNAAKKDIFNLQLENHFLKERLSNMAPDHIEGALNENVKLKLEILNISKEMKKLKKILTQQDKDLAEAQKERERGIGRGSSELKEVEALYQAEREKRRAAEQQAEEEIEARANLEAELDDLKGKMEDQQAEMEKLRDAADRAEDELDKVKSEMGGIAQGDAEVLEEEINVLKDKLAAAQLDVDTRDSEIEQLNEELDLKVRDHEKEISEVEAEWREEVIEARSQVDELKDALEQREQDVKDLREALMEKEEELALAHERIAGLQNVQAETHDRLEETLKNIEADNVEKEKDLVAANREIEELGQRVYDLEEACEGLRAKEAQLDEELRSADEAFDQAKVQYEDLVVALKDARKKLQDERDEAVAHARDLDEKRDAEREDALRDRKFEIDRLQRALSDREQVNLRLQNDLDAARDRVTQRDEDLAALQATMRNLQSDRRRMGDESTSARYGLELEIERVKRDLIAVEDDLARARDELERSEDRLRERDGEVSALLDKQRDLENRLASERQGRLNISDKLDLANKQASQHERDAKNLRSRIADLEPRMSERQQASSRNQRQMDAEKQERSELLLRVFRDINRFLGTDDAAASSNFTVFRDTLLSKLRAMLAVRTDMEKRIRETEHSVDQRMGSLKKQLDSKWRALDSFEGSVKKLEMTRMQWKSKYALKEGELEAAKTRISELTTQLNSMRAGSSTADTAQIRSLTERALSAEKRANNANNHLALLESKLQEQQARAGQAEDKWAARVKEYENRLRIAGEKIKTEKQGGKERARHLEEQVRDLERQVDAARRRNQRVEGVVANARNLVPDSPGL